MNVIIENYRNYKIGTKLNDAKNNLDKVSEMAKQLGVYADDIDRMKNQSITELQKILLNR